MYNLVMQGFGDHIKSLIIINENENYPNIQLRFGNFNKEERKKTSIVFAHNVYYIFYHLLLMHMHDHKKPAT